MDKVELLVLREWRYYVKAKQHRRYQIQVAQAYSELVGLYAAVGAFKVRELCCGFHHSLVCIEVSGTPYPPPPSTALRPVLLLPLGAVQRSRAPSHHPTHHRMRTCESNDPPSHLHAVEIRAADPTIPLRPWRSPALFPLEHTRDIYTAVSSHNPMRHATASKSYGACCPRPGRWQRHMNIVSQRTHMRRSFGSWKAHHRWLASRRDSLLRPLRRWTQRCMLQQWKRFVDRQNFLRLSYARCRAWRNHRLLNQALRVWRQQGVRRARAAALSRRVHRRTVHMWFVVWAYSTRHSRLVRLWRQAKALDTTRRAWQAWRVFLYRRLGKYTADCYYVQRARQRHFAAWARLPAVRHAAREQLIEAYNTRMQCAFSTWQHTHALQDSTNKAKEASFHVQQGIVRSQRYFFLWVLALDKPFRVSDRHFLARRARRSVRQWADFTFARRTAQAARDTASVFRTLQLCARYFTHWALRPKHKSKLARAKDHRCFRLQATAWTLWRRNMQRNVHLAWTASKARQDKTRERYMRLAPYTKHAVRRLFAHGQLHWTWSRWYAYARDTRQRRQLLLKVIRASMCWIISRCSISASGNTITSVRDAISSDNIWGFPRQIKLRWPNSDQNSHGTCECPLQHLGSQLWSLATQPPPERLIRDDA
ncbi:Aste57867_21328 [Aphanomyces stellatus]|uniref:Aste57867_21328 protein n=1 Tax=Aphanomyces stellatus TaxID=120398 RepID=A0A485LLT6_9STRA|nr:hypothetical protein As57867_021259 [Aphanomyces stellatus]VFT98000.1 Aste57867_21328 [Aphanomyces stellatus]